MKNVNFNIYLILFFGVSFLFNSCQTEEIVLKQFGKEIPITKKQVRYLDSKQSRHISAKLATKFNKPFGKNETNNFTVLSTNVGEIDLTKVLEITNEFGVTNYTYLVKPTSITLEKFYNIVYSTYDDKEKVVLYEYLMTEDFKNAYYTGQKLIAQFEGSIKTQLITNSFPCNPPLIENPQTPVFGGIENSPYPNDSNLPDFNPSIVVSNPFYNSPGFWFNLGQNGNGSGSGGGGGGGSEVPSCGWVIYVVKCNGGGGHDGSEPRCTGTFKGATYAVDTCTGFFVQIYKNSNTKKGENSEESEGSSNPCPPVDGIGILEPSTTFMNFVFNLPTDLKNWLTKPYPQGSPEEIKDLIENYVNSTNADLAFATWLTNYIYSNQNIDINQIEGMFFSSYPQIDQQIEIDPSLISYDTPLTQQNLPTLDSFINNFPKNGQSGSYTQMPASQVYSLIQGSLLNSFINNPNAYGNACAIRGSRGLLYSGIDIPVLNYNGSQRTQKGGDLKNYILDAVSFNKFMIDKFGDTPYKLEGSAANDLQQVVNLLNGKNGIYVIINNSSSTAGYSGHVDAIINGSCIGDEYLLPSGGVKSIRVWVLN